jgi:hypothetical protein
VPLEAGLAGHRSPESHSDVGDPGNRDLSVRE